MIAIIGARSKDLLLFENELKSFCDEVLISTDDGSYGHKGFVTDLLKDRLEKDKKVQEVVAVGPVPMMQAVAGTTLPFGRGHDRQLELAYGGRHRDVRARAA